MTEKKAEKEEIELLKKILKKEDDLEKEEHSLKDFETKLLKKILEKEKDIEEEEKKIEAREEKVEKILKRLYRNVNEWKIKIWNSCEEKKIVDKGDEIVYYCNVMNKVCNFDDCPKNGP
ncbi:hypothetical protein GF327_02795 [Candidatus Woesearchaeota archaeon]|nr:hypothetical protein [Candidatus Woesearchaeota archaeon]